MEYKIIRNFDVPKNLLPLPKLPLDKMGQNDAIKVEDNGTMKAYSLWHTRLNRLCKNLKLVRSDFKVSSKNDTIHIVRVYVTKQDTPKP